VSPHRDVTRLARRVLPPGELRCICAALQTTTTDADRHQQAKQNWGIGQTSKNIAGKPAHCCLTASTMHGQVCNLLKFVHSIINNTTRAQSVRIIALTIYTMQTLTQQCLKSNSIMTNISVAFHNIIQAKLKDGLRY